MVTNTAAAAQAATDPATALAAVPHTDDVVEYTLRCVLALAPGLQAAVVEAADRQVRGLFGRTNPYIACRAGEGRSARNQQIRRDHQAGERVPLLMRRYGLSDPQIRRILRGD